MIRDEADILRRLTHELGLKDAEARTYIGALKAGRLLIEEGSVELVRSLLARGMLIESADDEKTYLPVHPRLALSNLFRSYQDRMTPQMREKRRMVDKLTLELIPVYEAGKKRKGE